MFFRKALVRIRKEYNTNRTKLFLFSSIATTIALIIGALLDAFLPFVSWANLIRSIVLIPSAISIFVLGYAISLHLHYKQVETNPEWVPYRMRMSPSWRIRISIIVGAFMLVFIYATGFSVGYTFISSIFAAIGLALAAFIRSTQAEKARQEFDLPDARDINYNKKFNELSKQREERKQQSREERKKEKEAQKNKDKEDKKESSSSKKIKESPDVEQE